MMPESNKYSHCNSTVKHQMEEEIPDYNAMPLPQQAAEYLDKHQIYDLFSSIVSSLAIDRPSDPKSYIIQKLQSGDTYKIFLICNNGNIAQTVAKLLATNFKSKLYFNDDDNSVDITTDKWTEKS